MKILVTGANGMLGSSLCGLYQSEHEIYALHRDIVCYAPSKANFSVDLNNEVKLGEIFDQVQPDLVIHTAGATNVDQCEKMPAFAYENNVSVTESIARLCNNVSTLIYISTDQVYGENPNHSEENNSLLPINEYGKTKYLGENSALKHALKSIVIRTNIFGWNIKPDRISSAEWIYHTLKDGNKITLFDDYYFSPISSENLGAVILQLVQIDFCGIINIGSPTSCSKYEFGISLAETFRFNSELISKGSMSDYNFFAPRVNNLNLNTAKIAGLGIHLPDYKSSLKNFKKTKPD